MQYSQESIEADTQAHFAFYTPTNKEAEWKILMADIQADHRLVAQSCDNCGLFVCKYMCPCARIVFDAGWEEERESDRLSLYRRKQVFDAISCNLCKKGAQHWTEEGILCDDCYKAHFFQGKKRRRNEGVY